MATPTGDGERVSETVGSDEGDGPAPRVPARAGEIYSLHGESDDLFCSECHTGRQEGASALERDRRDDVRGDQVEYTAGARYTLSACKYAIRPRPPLNIHKATPLCSQTSLKASGTAGALCLKCRMGNSRLKKVSRPRGNQLILNNVFMSYSDVVIVLVCVCILRRGIPVQ